MSQDINENTVDAGLQGGNVARGSEDVGPLEGEAPDSGSQFEKQVEKTIVDGFYVVSAGARLQNVAANTPEEARSLFRSVYDIEPTDCVPYEGSLLPGVAFLYVRDGLKLVGDIVQTSQYKRWKGV